MKVNAFVAEGSHPVRGWESRRKVSGTIAGVRFFKKGRTFVASDLSPEEVDRVRHNRFVQIEILSSRPKLSAPLVPPKTTVEAPALEPRTADHPPNAETTAKIDPLIAAFGPVVKRRGRKPKPRE